jgi:hypothetical protein
MVEKGINSPNILFAEIIKVTMWLIIGAWSIIALIALLGLPPFQRKRREWNSTLSFSYIYLMAQLRQWQAESSRANLLQAYGILHLV